MASKQLTQYKKTNKLPTKIFEYGPNSSCDIYYNLLCCPFGGCLVPSTSYNIIIFNEQKLQLQKYNRGGAIFYQWWDSPPEFCIPFDDIAKMEAVSFDFLFQYKVKKSPKQVIYLPESCFKIDQQSYCCPLPFTLNVYDCFWRNNYGIIASQICLYWQNRSKIKNQQYEEHPSLNTLAV